MNTACASDNNNNNVATHSESFSSSSSYSELDGLLQCTVQNPSPNYYYYRCDRPTLTPTQSQQSQSHQYTADHAGTNNNNDDDGDNPEDMDEVVVEEIFEKEEENSDDSTVWVLNIPPSLYWLSRLWCDEDGGWCRWCGGSNQRSSGSSIEAKKYQQKRQIRLKVPTLRRWALLLSLHVNILILLVKFVAYIQSGSLSVLAALLDSLLDIVSQLILNYTSRQQQRRSSAFYPAGAARLEPMGVLSCAALMGMASFEVMRESAESLLAKKNPIDTDHPAAAMASFYQMLAIIVTKSALLYLCQRASSRRSLRTHTTTSTDHHHHHQGDSTSPTIASSSVVSDSLASSSSGVAALTTADSSSDPETTSATLLHHPPVKAAAVQQIMRDPTLDAVAQDHFNDILSNAVAACALIIVLQYPHTLWWLDPVGALLISAYIVYSWYGTGREQIEHLTGKVAPHELIQELRRVVTHFDPRIVHVDTIRAYHFGPQFLVEIEVVLPQHTLLRDSHDIGIDLQYEIESRDDIERCFVHIDYETRPYDEHVVSKVPELRALYRPQNSNNNINSNNNNFHNQTSVQQRLRRSGTDMTTLSL